MKRGYGGGGEGAAKEASSRFQGFKAVGSLTLNVASTCAIVFANKAVFSVYNFQFLYALTLVHSAVTALGMIVFATLGLFQIKQLPATETVPLALAFVGYVVFWNYSLKLNTVGFYQLSKVMITPAVVLLEIVVSKKYPTVAETGTFVITCLGVALATVTDPNMSANMLGVVISLTAVCFSALYQVWAGSKQKQLQASSMQLMHQYTPHSVAMMVVLTALCEPLGLRDRTPDTLLGFDYSLGASLAIAASAGLALLVSLSTFLTIGATSAVTFNVVGHLKTFFIMAGGVLLFGEKLPLQKACGIAVAMVGIVAYSYLKLSAASLSSTKPAASSVAQPLLTPAGSAGVSLLVDLDIEGKGVSPDKGRAEHRYKPGGSLV